MTAPVQTANCVQESVYTSSKNDDHDKNGIQAKTWCVAIRANMSLLNREIVVSI